MNKQQEPRLRFKGFSGAWEYKKFENVLSIKSGMSQKEIEVSDGIYPILATGGEIGRTNTALYDKESVLIGRKGTIDKPYYMNTPFWTVDTLFYSELKNNIDGKFLYFLFQCIEWRKLDTSTGVPSLTSTTIHEIQRYFPSKPEQTHLGLFFRRLDSQIAESRAVLEKSRQLKKAMLAKMFPTNGEKIPKIRFKGFEGEWEEKKLGEVVQRITRKNTNLDSLLPLTISAQNGLIAQTEFFDNQVAGKNLTGYYLIENGEFAYNKSYSNGYPWGAIKRLDRHKNGVLSTLYILFKPTFASSQYLVSYFDGTNWHGEVASIAGEGARNHGLLNIPVHDFFEIKILLPCSLQEQTAIGNFFRQLDETIALQSAEVEKLNQLKKGLLAAMLV